MTDTAEQAQASAGPWETNAGFWVQIIRENRDKYRNELTNAAVLNAIGSPSQLAVLDAGCGEGYLGRLLARDGATVTGIDSSANLIEAARRQQLLDGLTVAFDVGSVEALPYGDNQFDLVICNHVLNDLRDASLAITEFSRVLHSGGRLVILMLHPSFYNKHAERDQATNDPIATSYFKLRHIDQPFEVDGLVSPAANTAWFRPLEFYTQALSQAGFVITSLTEPHPTSEQIAADPWWRQGFTRPLFMLLVSELT
jgi:2-polyprenyl-3-methyl-5-hydroxy-6-metoxy-1,4-benzoquinol methylase